MIINVKIYKYISFIANFTRSSIIFRRTSWENKETKAERKKGNRNKKNKKRTHLQNQIHISISICTLILITKRLTSQPQLLVHILSHCTHRLNDESTEVRIQNDNKITALSQNLTNRCHNHCYFSHHSVPLHH